MEDQMEDQPLYYWYHTDTALSIQCLFSPYVPCMSMKERDLDLSQYSTDDGKGVNDNLQLILDQLTSNPPGMPQNDDGTGILYTALWAQANGTAIVNAWANQDPPAPEGTPPIPPA